MVPISVDGIISLKNDANINVRDDHEWLNKLESFTSTPKISARKASRELAIPVKSVWRAFRKHLHLCSYCLQLFFKHHGALPHWLNPVNDCLNNVLPVRWVGHKLHPIWGYAMWCDFYPWGFIMDYVYLLPIPAILNEETGSKKQFL